MMKNELAEYFAEGVKFQAAHNKKPPISYAAVLVISAESSQKSVIERDAAQAGLRPIKSINNMLGLKALNLDDAREAARRLNNPGIPIKLVAGLQSHKIKFVQAAWNFSVTLDFEEFKQEQSKIVEEEKRKYEAIKTAIKEERTLQEFNPVLYKRALIELGLRSENEPEVPKPKVIQLPDNRLIAIAATYSDPSIAKMLELLGYSSGEFLEKVQILESRMPLDLKGRDKLYANALQSSLELQDVARHVLKVDIGNDVKDEKAIETKKVTQGEWKTRSETTFAKGYLDSMVDKEGDKTRK